MSAFDQPVKFRLPRKLHARLLRIGEIKVKKPSELGREAFLNYVQQEEERLGISKAKPKAA